MTTGSSILAMTFAVPPQSRRVHVSIIRSTSPKADVETFVLQRPQCVEKGLSPIRSCPRARTLKPRGSGSGPMAAKEPNVARFVAFEGAVDDRDRSRPIDGQLPHQQALPATVVA